MEVEKRMGVVSVGITLGIGDLGNIGTPERRVIRGPRVYVARR